MAEIQGNGTSNEIINYGVSSKEGKIYRSSKTPEDGFQEVELKSGGFTYHKYLNGLSGKITYLNRDVKEINKDSKRIKIDTFKVFLNDGVSTQALGLTTYSQEWKLFIKHLFNSDFAKPVIASYYKKNVGERSYLNLSIKYENDLNAEGKNNSPEWLDCNTKSKGGVVPDPIKNRKDEWDWTDNDIWYQEKMEELIARFQSFKLANPSQATAIPQSKTKLPSQSASQAFEPATNVKEEEYDDLPF